MLLSLLAPPVVMQTSPSAITFEMAANRTERLRAKLDGAYSEFRDAQDALDAAIVVEPPSSASIRTRQVHCTSNGACASALSRALTRGCGPSLKPAGQMAAIDHDALFCAKRFLWEESLCSPNEDFPGPFGPL